MEVERMFFQAWKTIFLNQNVIQDGDTLNPFNMKINQHGISPAMTTRPDGFKTAILVIEMTKES